MPVWHASVAVLIPGAPFPTPTALVTGSDAKRAKAFAVDLLGGVGRLPERASITDFTFHFRRALAPAEIEQLDPAWLACPAVDHADMPDNGRGVWVIG